VDVALPSSAVASVDVASPSSSASASASVSGFQVLSPFVAAAAALVGPGVVPTSGSNVAGGSGALEQSVLPPAFTGFASPSASPSSESSSAGGGQVAVAGVQQRTGRTWRLLNRPERPSSAPTPSAAVRDFWLDSCLADSSLTKYKVQWEEWCAYAASHSVSVLPPDKYALEQFIVELAEFTQSTAVVDGAVAAINHFFARNRFVSPLTSPYFALIRRGIRNECKTMPVPRMPFLADHILKFLGMAWISEDLRVWRGILPHVICFQQLMRGERGCVAERFQRCSL
jgi:hypothetical protein